MKPFLEKVTNADGASWAMLNRRLDEAIPFEWHHHPEFELTLTLNSRGQRYIGDHIGSYGHGDLVLLGPGLPHTWASEDKIDPAHPHVALVMWFRPGWANALTGTLTELHPVKQMLERAGQGLKFSPSTAEDARPRIETLFGKPPAERLLDLIAILTRLAADRDAEPLAAPGRALPPVEGDRSRIDRVLSHIHAHYAEPLSIAELAGVAALSPSGFHRLFRRHTRLSFTDYVARLRIGEACALLSGTTRPIAHIADSIGYGSLANFNRQFRALKHMTPRAYRTSFTA